MDTYAENTCAICLDVILEKNNKSIDACKHVFHEDCLNMWLERNRSCPMCRISIPYDTHEQKRYTSFGGELAFVSNDAPTLGIHLDRLVQELSEINLRLRNREIAEQINAQTIANTILDQLTQTEQIRQRDQMYASASGISRVFHSVTRLFRRSQ